MSRPASQPHFDIVWRQNSNNIVLWFAGWHTVFWENGRGLLVWQQKNLRPLVVVVCKANLWVPPRPWLYALHGTSNLILAQCCFCSLPSNASGPAHFTILPSCPNVSGMAHPVVALCQLANSLLYHKMGTLATLPSRLSGTTSCHLRNLLSLDFHWRHNTTSLSLSLSHCPR